MRFLVYFIKQQVDKRLLFPCLLIVRICCYAPIGDACTGNGRGRQSTGSKFRCEPPDFSRTPQHYGDTYCSRIGTIMSPARCPYSLDHRLRRSNHVEATCCRLVWNQTVDQAITKLLPSSNLPDNVHDFVQSISGTQLDRSGKCVTDSAPSLVEPNQKAKRDVHQYYAYVSRATISALSRLCATLQPTIP